MKLFLEAGETRSITEDGYSCYVVAADGPISVRLSEHDGELIEAEELSAGQGIKARNRFERYSIKNNHTAAQWVTLYTGAAEFVDNRNVGTVSVDGVVQISPIASIGQVGQFANNGEGQSVGSYYELYYFNPEDSGKNMYLRAIRFDNISLDNSFTFQRRTGVTKSMMIANAGGTYGPMNAVESGGGVVGMFANRVNSSLWTPADFDCSFMNITSSSEKSYKFETPIMIKPGEVIYGYSSVTDEKVWAYADFVEVAV